MWLLMITKAVIFSMLYSGLIFAANATQDNAAAQMQNSPIPSFDATTLTGKSVNSDQLVGQPNLLIITPSKGAAGSTREWVEALNKSQISVEKLFIRDVICIDLPFFIGIDDAISKAKDQVPPHYHDQTWLLDSNQLEKALDIPIKSNQAFILVLDETAEIVARVSGKITDKRINQVETAVQKLLQKK